MNDRWIAIARERIRDAVESRIQLSIEGGGTRRDFGGAVRGVPFPTAGYSGIVEYDPSDLVIRVRSGTRLEDLDAVLAAHGQVLPFEPPRREGSTVGGAIALGWSGPRRPFFGAVRDHLLGVRMLDGCGRDLRFGGPVVKNVAGFDVARLLGGSLGILGLLLDVSLRVMPGPSAERSCLIEASPQQALRRMRELPRGPGLMSAACHVDGGLILRSSGSIDCVGALLARQGGRLLSEDEGKMFWRAFRDQTHPFFTPAEEHLRLWRLSVRSDAPHPWTADQAAIDWGGALRWVWAPLSAGAELADWAQVHGGHACLWAHAADAERSSGSHVRMPEALLRIHRKLADVFDPQCIFNRGRMLAPAYPEA